LRDWVRMNKKNKKPLLPKWRFPEFNNTGEWSTQEFKDLIEIIEERAGSKKYTLVSVTAGEGLVSQIEKFGREIAGNAYKNYYVIRKGDFAYNKSATKKYPEGYISMLATHEKAALPNSIFTCFRITDENTYPKIFDHLFHANYHGAWLRRFIAVGARAHGSLNVDTKHLLDMPVVLPIFPEQQKIADCLTSLDELSTAETEKLEAYKAHKKGLVQKLFPAEGKTVPEWRFPEFRGSGEWEEKEVGEVFTVTRGYVLSMQILSEEYSRKSPYPVFSSQTKNNGLAGYYKDFLYENAITWTTDGANAGDVNYRSGKFYCTNVCGVLLNSDGYANPFTAELINSVSSPHFSQT
jgi:type I restriction enzyme S subunit